MKKIYTLLFVTLILVAAADAQRSVSSTFPVKTNNPFVFASSQNHLARTSAIDDTLTGHFVGSNILYGSSGGGLVCGHNAYGDLGKMQLFDATYGVSGPGVITGILFYMGWVEGNPNSFITATIWDNIAGAPGTVLGTVDIPFSAMDTTAAGYFAIASAPDTALYNGVAVFGTPVAIPASQSFWAGFTYTYIAGDTVGLVSTTDGDFPDAITHTWEQWSDNSFHSFNNGTTTWQLDIALGIFPTMSFGVGIQEPSTSNGFSLFQNYPNPAGNETAISYSLDKTTDVSFIVTDITGRTIITVEKGNQTQGAHTFTLNTSSLSAGAYIITMRANETRLSTRMMVSK